jgi:hypothetical protein
VELLLQYLHLGCVKRTGGTLCKEMARRKEENEEGPDRDSVQAVHGRGVYLEIKGGPSIARRVLDRTMA